MSDIEQIQTIQKPKRVYNRRSPVLPDVPEPISPERSSGTSPVLPDVPIPERSSGTSPVLPDVPEIAAPKPKVKRASKTSSIKTAEPERSSGTSPVLPDVPEIVSQVKSTSIKDGLVSEIRKKPRTDKQIQAFNKMREQRLLKTAKINELKQFEKEQRLMDKEEARLEKLREKLTKSKNSKIASDEPPYLEQHISPLADKSGLSPGGDNYRLSPGGDNYRLSPGGDNYRLAAPKLSTIPKYVFV